MPCPRGEVEAVVASHAHLASGAMVPHVDGHLALAAGRRLDLAHQAANVPEQRIQAIHSPINVAAAAKY